MKRSAIATLVITLIIAIGIIGVMWYLCYRVGSNPPTDHIINLAILIASIAIGWLFGTFVSPDTPDEETRFSRLGTAIKAFVSGYLVSKMDKLFTVIFDPDKLFQNLPMFRFLLFVTGLIVAALVTYVLREYVLPSPTTVVVTTAATPEGLATGGQRAEATH
jgi:hypothetical protein